jgi:hypothetical protein
VHGPSGIGKTQFLAYLCEREGKTFYLANNINSLKTIPDQVDYILFDDFGFDKDPENMIAVFDCETKKVIRVLYAVVKIPLTIRRVFSSNRTLARQLDRLVDLDILQRKALERRIVCVNQVDSLRVKDYKSELPTSADHEQVPDDQGDPPSTDHEQVPDDQGDINIMNSGLVDYCTRMVMPRAQAVDCSTSPLHRDTQSTPVSRPGEIELDYEQIQATIEDAQLKRTYLQAGLPEYQSSKKRYN